MCGFGVFFFSSLFLSGLFVTKPRKQLVSKGCAQKSAAKHEALSPPKAEGCHGSPVPGWLGSFLAIHGAFGLRTAGESEQSQFLVLLPFFCFVFLCSFRRRMSLFQAQRELAEGCSMGLVSVAAAAMRHMCGGYLWHC